MNTEPKTPISFSIEKPEQRKNISLIIKQSPILQQIQAGHTQEAINTLTQLLEIQSNNAFAHNDLGVLLFPLTEPTARERALKHLERALTLNPADSGILENLIKVYQFFGKNREAVDTLTMALTQPGDSTRTLKIAQLYALLGYEAQAKQLRSTVTTPSPPSLPVSSTTAESARITLTIAQPTVLQAVQAGRTSEMVEMLNHLLPTQPSNALNYNDLGALLFANEPTRPQGFTHLETALALQPNNPIIVRNLARVYTLFKRNDEAKTLWENLLRLKPDDAEAKSGLAQFITIELPILGTTSPKSKKEKAKKRKRKR